MTHDPARRAGDSSGTPHSAAVRAQSAGHPVGTVAPHRYPSIKGQVSDPQGRSPQVADLARY